MTRARVWRWCASASLAALAAWAALFALVLAEHGAALFDDPSSRGRGFWLLQATLLFGVFGTTFPLARRWVSRLAALRLLLALGLLLSLAALWGVTHGMRY